MTDTPTSSDIYRFGGFSLDTRTRELKSDNGAVISITSKALDTLSYLVTNRDRVVNKNELLNAIWPGRVVEENNLNQAVSALRNALGTGAKDRRFIVTLPGKGYRFVAEVALGEAQPDALIDKKVNISAKPDPFRKMTKVFAGVSLLVFIALGVKVWLGTRSIPPVISRAPALTLVVLPFHSLNDKQTDPLLEIGLSDTLITRLGRHHQLLVRSLESVLSAVESESDPIAVGRRLQADYLVDGSTQRLNDQVRVNVRLVDLRSGTSIWTNSFRQPMTNLFQLQDDISAALDHALGFLKNDAVPQTTASPCEGENVDAYRALLTGRRRTMAPDAERLQKALDAFYLAIDLDPSCASAYAGMAGVFRSESIAGNSDPREMMPLSLAAAQQAISINPSLAEAYVQLGFFHLWYERNWVAAETEFVRAVELNPNLSSAHFGYAHLLIFLNRFDEGLYQINLARELDPLSPLVNTIHAGMHGTAGEEDAAIKSLGRSLELAPHFWLNNYVRAGIMLDQGAEEAAVADLEIAAERSDGNSQVLGMLIMAYAAAGNIEGAKEVLEKLELRSKDRYVPPTALAAGYVAVGEIDRALDLLEQAYSEHDVRIAYLGIDARWNLVRDLPRFQNLLAKLGFSAEKAHGRF